MATVARVVPVDANSAENRPSSYSRGAHAGIFSHRTSLSPLQGKVHRTARRTEVCPGSRLPHVWHPPGQGSLDQCHQGRRAALASQTASRGYERLGASDHQPTYRQGSGETVDQYPPSQLLSGPSIRELVEEFDEREDKPGGVMQAWIMRRLAGLLMRFGFRSDFPSS